MLEHSGDLFKQRAARLGLERGDALVLIQAELDKLYPNQTRANKLQDGVLTIHALNAPVASELRMRQGELMAMFRQLSSEQIERLIVKITA